jgi:hypothetical protein
MSESNKPNCPFYGRALFMGILGGKPPFVLVDQEGNQCALVMTAYAPCRMEIDGDTPDWRTCLLVREIRMEVID